jgi:hypothetical protein
MNRIEERDLLLKMEALPSFDILVQIYTASHSRSSNHPSDGCAKLEIKKKKPAISAVNKTSLSEQQKVT